MIPNHFGNYIVNKSSLECKELSLHCSLTMVQVRGNIPKMQEIQITKVNKNLV